MPRAGRPRASRKGRDWNQGEGSALMLAKAARTKKGRKEARRTKMAPGLKPGRRAMRAAAKSQRGMKKEAQAKGA